MKEEICGFALLVASGLLSFRGLDKSVKGSGLFRYNLK